MNSIILLGICVSILMLYITVFLILAIMKRTTRILYDLAESIEKYLKDNV